MPKWQENTELKNSVSLESRNVAHWRERIVRHLYYFWSLQSTKANSVFIRTMNLMRTSNIYMVINLKPFYVVSTIKYYQHMTRQMNVNSQWCVTWQAFSRTLIRCSCVFIDTGSRLRRWGMYVLPNWFSWQHYIKYWYLRNITIKYCYFPLSSL